MTLQEKLAAIQWPADIERVGAYHVYRGKYYGTLDDGQSAETAYERDRASARPRQDQARHQGRQGRSWLSPARDREARN